MLTRSKDVTPQVEMIAEAVQIQVTINAMEASRKGYYGEATDFLYAQKKVLRTVLVERLGYMDNAQFTLAVEYGAREIEEQERKYEEEAV